MKLIGKNGLRDILQVFLQICFYLGIIILLILPFILAMIFLFILYIGVSIAIYILSELFKQATEYKNENELTI